MNKAKNDNREFIVSLLADSFKDNLSVNYIVRQDEIRLKRIRALMEYSFDMCFNFGEVWLSDDGKGCALMLYPHLKKFSRLSIWLDVRLIFKAIGLTGITKALKREGLIKKMQPKEKMVYLWFIGVNSTAQHTGIGSKLLEEIIELSGNKGLPIYLETSTLTNLPWYEKHGFEIYGNLELDYTLYFLKRKLKKN